MSREAERQCIRLFILPPMTRILTARNSFYTLRNGCCQGVVDSCSTTLHNFLRTVQASVDKRADECGQVCRNFPMSPTLHNALIITQFSIISTECRHYCCVRKSAVCAGLFYSNDKVFAHAPEGLRIGYAQGVLSLGVLVERI